MHIKKIFYKEIVLVSIKILILLLIILPFSQLFHTLPDVISGRIPAFILFSAVLLGVVSSFPMILTIALFLAITIVINRYSKENELVIFMTSGVSPMYFLRQVFYLALPITVLCGIFSVSITPIVSGKMDKYMQYLTNHQTLKLIAPNVFKEINGDQQLLFTEKYNPDNGEAHNVFIRYKTDANRYIVLAKSAKLFDTNNFLSLNLENGTIKQLNFNQYFMDVSFEHGKISLPDHTNLDNAQSNGTAPFLNLITRLNESDVRGELSWRFSIAIMALVMALLVVPFAMQVSRVQNNFIFILPPAVFAIYQNIVLSINYGIRNNQTSIFVMIALHLGLILFAIFMCYIKSLPYQFLRAAFRK